MMQNVKIYFQSFLVTCLLMTIAFNCQAQRKEMPTEIGAKVSIRMKFEQVKNSYMNTYVEIKHNGYWGIMNALNELVLPCEYDTLIQIKHRAKSVYYIISKDEKFGALEIGGDMLLSLDYQDVESYAYGDIIAAKKDGKWGFLTEKEADISFEYTAIGKNQKRLFCVEKEHKWGAIKMPNQLIIPFEYDSVSLKRGIYFKVKNGAQYGMMDTLQQVLIPIEYEAIDHYTEEQSLVKKDGKWGILKDGKLDTEAERMVFWSPDTRPQYKHCPEDKQTEEACTHWRVNQELGYIYRSIQYPAEARENGIVGTVVVQIIIAPTGKIVDPKILRGIGGGCEEEVLRIMNEMPDWEIPATHEGKKVWSRLVYPVKFKLE